MTLTFQTLIVLGTILSTQAKVLIKDEKTCKTYPCLIFKDDFKSLDFNVWEHIISMAATGNKEFQFYTNNRSNSYIQDEKLFLKPTLTTDQYNEEYLTSGTLDLWGSTQHNYCTANRQGNGCLRKGTPEAIINPIQSAAVRSSRSFSFKYGKMVVKAKMPRGDWIWPAIWLMPKYSEYGEWPASGEIDLVESRGNDELRDSKGEICIGNKMIQQSLHWGPFYPEDGQMKTHGTAKYGCDKEGSYADDFHTFGLEWSEDSIRMTVNGEQTLKVKIKDGGFWKLGEFEKMKGVNNPWKAGTNMAPFDQPFFIILNLAVGGTVSYFHKDNKPTPPWDNDGDPQKAMNDFWKAKDQWLPSWKEDETALQVDYIKIWKQKPDP